MATVEGTNLRIVIIGAPGCGKSTLTRSLCGEFPGTRTFGVRSYFDRAIKNDTELGRRAASAVAQQIWIADDVVAAAVAQELDDGLLGDSFILEGMPGNAPQARMLDEVLAERGTSLDAAVNLVTPREVCVERASRRTVCEVCDGGSHQAQPDADGRCLACGTSVVQRRTDAPAEFLKRLAVYEQIEGPLVQFYRSSGRLVDLDGLLPPGEMTGACVAALRLLCAAEPGAPAATT